METFKPSGQQKDIIEAVDVYDSIKVHAFAGTGKTTTLREIATAYPNLNFLYLAFNKAVQKEAEERFPQNVTVKTTHGFALSYVRNFLPIDFRSLGQNLNVKTIQMRYKLQKTEYVKALAISKLFAKFCHSDYDKLDENILRELLKTDHELNVMMMGKKVSLTDVNFYIGLIFKDMEKGAIPMSHDFYVKYFQLNIDKFKDMINYDVVMLDEAQDTNEITMSIVNKLNGKKIFVGDAHQQIYSFRGSLNAMDKFVCEKDLHLTETFRFPNKISDDANYVLNNFLGEKNKIISYFPNKTGDIETKCYITRTNAGLIELFNNLTTDGKIVKTVRDVDSIFGLVNTLYHFDRDPTIKYRTDERRKLQVQWILMFKDMDEVKSYIEDTNDIELKNSVKLVEEYGSRIIDIYEKAKANRRKRKVDAFLTTAHTAKGQEWDQVMLHYDFPDILETIANTECTTLKDFRRSLNSDFFKESYRTEIEELNLFYVAITRGILETKASMPNSFYLGMNEEDLNITLRELVKKVKQKEKTTKTRKRKK